jgi:glucose/arabinose dehydrogenase
VVAQPPVAPEMLHPQLDVRAAVEGLTTPISMAFLDEDDFFVLEKNTGRVQRVTDGNISTVLDLAVNFASERGLLGIALHPDFPSTPHVYLYWTESTTGVDTDVLANTPLLGNRVDRYAWNGSTLTFDLNLIQLRALQPPNPPAEPGAFGNHDGGVLRFGPDDNLYIVIGDNGRRGQLQNLVNGPFGPGMPDDQFGGPAPDDAHFTGVVIRLNDDGTTPADNPFYAAGAAIGGEVGENIQKIYAYGIRNSFGMDFDPVSGDLWLQIHGDDSFDELDRLEPGANSGWIQFMGPSERIAQFRAIETDSVTVDPVTNRTYFGLQQMRYSPLRIATTRAEALSRLFMLPGSHYSEPEFSWKFAVAPGGMGFLRSSALGPQFENDLFMAASRTFLEDGYLFRFRLTNDREEVAVHGGLRDRVADNEFKFDITESEDLLIGRGFGIGTDVQTGPNGNLYVVSLSNGAIYEVFRSNPGQRMREASAQAVTAEAPGVFQKSARIAFSLAAPGRTSLTVFDAAGRQVRVLADRVFAEGSHEIAWDGRDGAGQELPAGVYFLRILAGDEKVTSKMLRVR